MNAFWLLVPCPFIAAVGGMLLRTSIRRDGSIDQRRYWGGMLLFVVGIGSAMFLLRRAGSAMTDITAEVRDAR